MTEEQIREAERKHRVALNDQVVTAALNDQAEIMGSRAAARSHVLEVIGGW